MEPSPLPIYSCGYMSNGQNWISRSVDPNKISTDEKSAVDIANEIHSAARETEPYESIVFNAVKMNPTGDITDIYMDIISNGMFRLQNDSIFNQKYHANYHRAYAAINDRPYHYGGNNLSPKLHKTYQSDKKEDNCGKC